MTQEDRTEERKVGATTLLLCNTSSAAVWQGTC